MCACRRRGLVYKNIFLKVLQKMTRLLAGVVTLRADGETA